MHGYNFILLDTLTFVAFSYIIELLQKESCNNAGSDVSQTTE